MSRASSLRDGMAYSWTGLLPHRMVCVDQSRGAGCLDSPHGPGERRRQLIALAWRRAGVRRSRSGCPNRSDSVLPVRLRTGEFRSVSPPNPFRARVSVQSLYHLFSCAVNTTRWFEFTEPVYHQAVTPLTSTQSSNEFKVILQPLRVRIWILSSICSSCGPLRFPLTGISISPLSPVSLLPSS